MSMLGTPNSDLHLPASVPGRPQRPKPAKPSNPEGKVPTRPLPAAAPARPGAKPAADPALTGTPSQQPAAVEEEYEDDEQGGGVASFLRSSPAFLVSMLFHMIVILVLALMTITLPEKVKEVSLFAGPNDEVEPLLEEELMDELDVEVEVEEFNSDSSSMMVIDPTSIAVSGEVSAEQVAPEDTLVAGIGVIDTEGLDSLMQEIGAGNGSDTGRGLGDLTATFGGTKTTGRKFVFVVDNSNSMGSGKLETAFSELDKAISGLKPSQSFYIIFYSDTAYGLFHPSTARTLVPATESNKARMRAWLATVEMCLQTRGEEAMKRAVAMRPDVIYLLGDGAFTDKADQYMVANPAQGIQIHTLGMQLKAKGQESFAKIASMHKGTYRDVGVTPEGKAAFQRDGQRPKNNKNGPIWGRALGAGKKK